MARVKWKNRTQEEKERILKEQEEQRRKKDTKENTINHYNPAVYLKIYNDGGIPILCFEHGWVRSEQYKIVDEIETPMLFDSDFFLEGKCPSCSKVIHRAYSAFNLEEKISLPLMINKLKQEGRLVDERRNNVTA